MKILPLNQIECFSTFKSIQAVDGLITGSRSLICLSSDSKYVHVLDKGVVPRYKFITDPIFKGISNLWAIKSHYQETIDEFVFMSSESSTNVFKMGDSLLTDVTSIMNIDKNTPTKLVYNLKNSGFIVRVTPGKITVADLSKVDSADHEFIKFEYKNIRDNWDLVYHHDLYLFCFSQETKVFSIFLMKNRPRDFNIVALVKEFDINSFGISNTEISCLLASSSDSGIVIVMASISGHVYRISLDLSYNFLRSESIFIGEIVEDMLFPKAESSSEVYLGTRSGNFVLIDFNTSVLMRIEKLSPAPVKLSQLCNKTLLAYNHDSSILIGENQKECIRRSIANWSCDCAIEFVYKFAESYVVGIKEDSLFIMSIPPLSENSLSKRTLFNSAKISAFLFNNSKKWILGSYTFQDKKNYVTLFDSSGSEVSSMEQGADEIVGILPFDDANQMVLIVSVTKDRSQSKINMINTDSKLEAKNEYICSGSIEKVKFSERYEH